ncbi:MAG: ABC transporter permease [bacterium]|nr:ABC transporter permease [bacterium]
MKFLDLLAMSVNNLRRRKLRTALTVLGVIIGTASIVVMVSLGIGLKELTVEQYAQYGTLTAINVYSDAYYGGGQEEDPQYLTAEVVKELSRMPHVRYVSPMLNYYVIMKQGVYEANISLYGVSDEFMQDIDLGEGSYPSSKDSELRMLVGNTVYQRFRNSKTNEYFWEMTETPDIDFMNKPMFVIFDTDAYYQSQYNQDSENKVSPPKKYMLKTAGMVAGGENDYNQYSSSIYVNIDLLEAQLKKIFKKKAIPGQPTTKKGKPYNYFIYEQLQVMVDDMENVTEVQKSLTDLGYQASSQMEWLEQSQKQQEMIQVVLGGIGAVSLFVAAIGIANTMMMSIYERTKEIGVIKVLGCPMGNIRTMFLMEAGFIGLMGGVIGIALSYAISYIINHVGGIGTLMMGIDGNISRIPLWLSGMAIVFAVFVGMIAGLFPALRAMRLSPLAAIRND